MFAVNFSRNSIIVILKRNLFFFIPLLELAFHSNPRYQGVFLPIP